MKTGTNLKICFLLGVLFAVCIPARADMLTYQQEFEKEVVEFANQNRIQIERLHRDVHANCYISLTIATTILSDGSVKDISLVASSSVPIVDKYFRYVIEQAAPFQRLSDHFDPVPEEITVTQDFRLDVSLWREGIRSVRPCEKLKPQEN